MPLLAEVEVGLTEPSFLNEGEWRHDWWDPKKPIGSPSNEALRIMQEKGLLPTAGQRLFQPPRSWIGRLLARFRGPTS